jgi:hypothetical protein
MCGFNLSTEESIILIFILVSVACGGSLLIYWGLTLLKYACLWKTQAPTSLGNSTVALTTTADADLNHFDRQVEKEEVIEYMVCRHSTEQLDLHICTDMEASYDEETLQPNDNMSSELDFWPKVALRCIIVMFLLISIGVLDRLFDGDHAHIFFAFGVLTLLVIVCIRCLYATEISAAVKAGRTKIIRIGIIMGISSLSLCAILVVLFEKPVLMMGLLVYGMLCLFLTSYQVCMVQQEANWTNSFVDVIIGAWVS